MIEDRPTTTADPSVDRGTEQSAVDAATINNRAGEPALESEAALPAAPPPAPPRVWSTPTVEVARQRTAELGRIAAKTAAMFAAIFANFSQKLAKICVNICAGIAAFGRQVIKEVPPALQLLGALGLCAILSIFGSVSFDNTLGKSCAIVFVPGFALAFGVVAQRWYQGLGDGRKRRDGLQTAGHGTTEAERSVAYADAKLAFALNAFGTERHQQAVVALIQAKTATELAFGPGVADAGYGPRPRIRDGGGSKSSRREGVSAPGHP